jgi:hypothetical protein
VTTEWALKFHQGHSMSHEGSEGCVNGAAVILRLNTQGDGASKGLAATRGVGSQALQGSMTSSGQTAASSVVVTLPTTREFGDALTEVADGFGKEQI